ACGEGMTARASKTVLVMDDSAIVLDAVRAVFEANGFHVLTAIDLGELERHGSHAPLDAIVLDVQMPEAFGDDIAQVLRDMREVSVPIVLFSNLDEPTLAQRAAEARVDGYVPKSAGVDALLARVTEVMKPL